MQISVTGKIKCLVSGPLIETASVQFIRMSRRDGKKEFDVPKWFDLPEITPSSRKRAGSAAVQEPEKQQLNWKPMTASRLDRKGIF